MFFYNLKGCGAEISGASVVPEPLPGVENFLFRRGGNCGKIRETAQPLIIIWDYGGDLSLLEHELRDEDGVGIPAVAPGKIAAVFAVPRKKRAAK